MDRDKLIQQMVQLRHTKMEQRPITVIWTMNNFHPIISHSDPAQVDDSQISKVNGNHQIAEAVGISQMTFVKNEPTAFLVGEEGIDLKTFFVPIKGFIMQFDIGHQIDGVSKALFPPVSGTGRKKLKLKLLFTFCWRYKYGQSFYLR